jgi:hypothetical protein
MTGSRRVVHLSSETWCECRRLQALHRAPPQQLTMLVVKPVGGPAASMKPKKKSCVRLSGIITLSVLRPSDGSGQARLRQGHNDQSRRGHQCSETTLTGESRLHISTPPPGIEIRSLLTGSKQVVHWTGEQSVNAVRLQALHKPNIMVYGHVLDRRLQFRMSVV